MDRYVWEGWTVGAFVGNWLRRWGNADERAKLKGTFQEQQELADWCRTTSPITRKGP